MLSAIVALAEGTASAPGASTSFCNERVSAIVTSPEPNSEWTDPSRAGDLEPTADGDEDAVRNCSSKLGPLAAVDGDPGCTENEA